MKEFERIKDYLHRYGEFKNDKWEFYPQDLFEMLYKIIERKK